MTSHSRVLILTLALAVGCGDSSDGDGNEDTDQTKGDTADGGAKASDAASSAHPKFTSVIGDSIDPLVANDCVTDVTAGDHLFKCDGINYYVLVDEQCTKKQCGVIFDIHGATMSGLQERDNTLLNEIAPGAGFVYVNPSKTDQPTGGTWNLTSDPPKIALAMDKIISAYRVNPKRVHVTGFSQGGFTTFFMLANHNDILASAAPVAGALEQPMWATPAWQPRVPILVMNGISDLASMIDASRMLIDTIVKGLSLTGGDEIDGDGHYSRKRWTGDGGMVLEYIEHDYGGQAVLNGHCIPGGIDIPGAPHSTAINATTCTTGDIKLHWGDIALQWFIDHPKP